MHTTNSIAEMYSLHIQFPRVPQDQFLALLADVEPEIASLLHTYQQVFDVPSALPPHRSHNLAIPLIHGVNPVKVKPYRYPFSQKQQIEEMVQDILEEGSIVPSNSPFSSPIILVIKKDGTWRFCVTSRQDITDL